MAHEIEAGGGRQRAGRARRGRHSTPLPLGAPCPNCATALAGPGATPAASRPTTSTARWCALAAEAIGGLFELDSRLWRTLPDLCCVRRG